MRSKSAVINILYIDTSAKVPHYPYSKWVISCTVKSLDTVINLLIWLRLVQKLSRLRIFWIAFVYARVLNLVDIIIIDMKLHDFHSDAVSRVVLEKRQVIFTLLSCCSRFIGNSLKSHLDELVKSRGIPLKQPAWL